MFGHLGQSRIFAPEYIKKFVKEFVAEQDRNGLNWSNKSYKCR